MAALVSVVRWGWRPAEFWQLTAGERAFVIAGLETELGLKEKIAHIKKGA